MENKKTCLYDKHVALGALMQPFAGFEMPIQYSNIKEEHLAVRNHCGVFDVSHMGEVFITGKDAQKYVNHIFTNDVTPDEPNKVYYGMMLYPDGGTVDDLLVYKMSETKFFLVINAANIDKDVDWMKQNATGFDIVIDHCSDRYGQLAIQGPEAEAVVEEVLGLPCKDLVFYTFKEMNVAGEEIILSRTGYTGEDGFEIYGSGEDMNKLWDEILKIGKEDGVMPCGLGCRDTLRFEAALPLYGNEMDDVITPLEAGLGYFVKLKQEADFIGKAPLAKMKEAGVPRKLIGLELTGKGIARHGAKVFKGDKEIGFVTTGYMSPTLGKTIANVIVDADQAEIGNEVQVEIRNKKVPAVLISKKFLKK